jgi:hypothetical protein
MITMNPPSQYQGPAPQHQAKAAPTIAELLAAQAPQTTHQDLAKQRLMESLGGPAPAADDRWGNIQHAVQTGINYWGGLQGIKDARQKDQMAQGQQASNLGMLAQLFGGIGGGGS